MENNKKFLRSTLMDISDLTNHRQFRSKNQTFHFGVNKVQNTFHGFNKPINILKRNEQYSFLKNQRGVHSKFDHNESSSQRSSPVKLRNQSRISKQQTGNTLYSSRNNQTTNPFIKDQNSFSSQIKDKMARSQYIANQFYQTKPHQVQCIQNDSKATERKLVQKQKNYFRQSLGSLSKLIKNTLKTQQSSISDLALTLKNGQKQQKNGYKQQKQHKEIKQNIKIKFADPNTQAQKQNTLLQLNSKKSDRHARTKSNFQKIDKSPNKLKYSYIQHTNDSILSQSKQYTSRNKIIRPSSQLANSLSFQYQQKKNGQSNYLRLSSAKSNFVQKKKFFYFQSQISLNDFKLGGIKGEGRFGKVYPAFHKKTGLLFAIKQIKKQAVKYMLDQFIQELKIQLYLNHPNIVKMYGYFSNEQNFYIILQYMEEGSLYSFIKKNKKLAEQQASSKLKQICSAVQYAHQNQVLHRDIKPQNIVMTCDVCKLCDFGWAIYSNDRRKTYCGTLDYVCPQILQGQSYDNCVDIWAIGVMAYQMLTGKAPFYNISKKQTMKKIVDCSFDFPKQVSLKAKQFVMKTLKKNPDQRHSMHMLMKDPFLQQ